MRTLDFEAVVIGSGCAGYNAADRLFDLGVKNIAVVTEGRNVGTSRNTGSDKQTYYKLSLAGDVPDSVMDMAKTLFAGGAMDGDTALAEAANSTRCFMKLAGLGVPFPTNDYGEFVGYKTDHDPGCRATSIGPYTSKKMTEVLEASVMSKKIAILDNLQAVRILTEGENVCGLIALDLSKTDEPTFVAIRSSNIVMATGGPAALYKNSVYPECHTGSSALALDAGAAFQNLSEWQYGLASIDFRWNVSGTYQQVLPRYISIDDDGVEREFLLEHFKTPSDMLKNIFLKGYEWPFDVRKIGGSSYIDLLVYRETVLLGRRVYLDFRREPTGLEGKFDGLDETVYNYLKNSDALIDLPIKRLEKMNPGAISLYADHGIDITKEPLRIAVCAQHHNGGVAVDANWESSVKGLYVAGEAAGTFGVFRPGGTALNSTQVGSLRAAEHIAYFADKTLSNGFADIAEKQISQFENCVRSHKAEKSTIGEMRDRYQSIMSRSFAFLRNPDDMKKAKAELETLKKSFDADNVFVSFAELGQFFKNREILSMGLAVADAMIYAAEHYGSRGSALVTTSGDVLSPKPIPENEVGRKEALMTVSEGVKIRSFGRPVRKIPDRDLWFERVWAKYRKNTNQN